MTVVNRLIYSVMLKICLMLCTLPLVGMRGKNVDYNLAMGLFTICVLQNF